ncbi:MAG: right-handed parallel beta-helix repeat-containing protein [Thermococcus sp.]|uniref:NosD domain-containing protein n=1 Tax=Thermococcus sp. TaxID=35749 RepID=UPI001DFC1C4F|nr:NosD domain-containing protein [Thermococcus sp.]MBO8174388.1 right-handed parallel beta-helix repeat-containing protein [Thermococcus sp.]
MKKWLMLFAILVFVGMAGIVKANGAYINTLPYEITTSGYYILNVSVSDFDPTVYGVNYAIKINVSNVVLDGAGHTIDGDDSGVEYGIYVQSAVNVTVKNVIVTGWHYGIYYEYVQNGNIINVTANSNTYDGIVLAYSNYSTLVNNTGNYNMISGFWLYCSNYNTLLNNTASNNYGATSGIDLFISHGNTLIGNTVNSNDGTGISVANSINNTLTSNLITSNDWGIMLGASSKNSIINNTILDNTWGVYLYSYSNNNTIANNTVNGSILAIYLEDSNYNIVSRNKIQSYTGVRVRRYSQRNKLIGNIITNSGDYAIELFDRGSNEIIGNVITNSGASGIDVQSGNNMILNNTIAFNQYSGILLFYKGGNIIANNYIYNNNLANTAYHGGIRIKQSSNNLIYNNYFNNTVNIYFDTVDLNIWNTTKTLGTNIIGGPYIGGNAWFKPDGTGFSETCTDADGDGICDEPFVLNSLNIDYLPLALSGDEVPPRVEIVYPQNITYLESITSIKVNVTDNSHQISRVIAEVDGEYNVTLIFDGTYYVNTTVNIGEGHHWIRIYAYDFAGNVNSTEIVYFTVEIPQRSEEGQFLGFTYFYYLRYIRLLKVFNESYEQAIQLGIDNETLSKVLALKDLAEEEWQLAWQEGSSVITPDVRAFIHLRKAYLYLKEAYFLLLSYT